VLDGASLEHEKETSLSVIGADIGGGAFMRAPFSSKGELGLLGTRLGGNLELSGAALANPGGDALSADTADIGGNAFLNDGFAATGTVRLLGTKVGRDLTCDDSTLEGDEVALLADGIEIGKSASFMGAGLRGTVRLIGATIGGVLSFDGATLAPTDQDSVALLADSVEIGEDVFLRQGFRTTGALRLSGAQIGANFELTDAVLDVGGGEALIATGTDVKGTLVLTGTRIAGGVALFKASAATLGDDLGPRGLGSWGSAHPLVLEDFSYATFDGEEAWDTDARFRWLRRTLSFDPGSWERLIEVYRTHGRDDEARSAAIAMENDRLRRGGLSPLRRAGRWILRVTIGHGYRPWLALLWAVAIVVPFALLVWRAPGGTFVPTSEGATGSPQPLAYSLDTFLPIVDLGEADQWTVTGGLRWVAWAVILLGWALTTIFVAGFTRIVRSV
jgi:hypothetical protein